MAVKSSKSETAEIEIIRLQTETLRFAILGTTPIILNRLSEKAKHELLMPKGKKSTAEKASTLKHEPYSEFRASPHRMRDENSTTLLAVPATAFKGAIRSAALDMPGSSKAQIGRLCFVPGEMIALYGVPQIFCAITRSADAARTPDVRTRAIVPKWAAIVDVTYSVPLLKRPAIQNLMAAAGINIGVGDWRPEKGSGNYGQFTLVDPEDPEFKAIVSSGGRDKQIAAIEAPTPYDDETEELLSWFAPEARRRGFSVVS